MRTSALYKFLVAIAVLAISGLAVAQDYDAAGDPPSRVMRLQYLQGEVSLQPGGVEDWVAANLNRPLTTADRIWTDRDARAELTMASAALRMGSETSVTLTNLDDQTAQIELDQGVLELSVRYLNPGEIVEVDTPNFAYTVMKPGEYRFDVVPQQDQSWITVRHGDGEATGEGNAVRVRSGQQFQFSGGQSLAFNEARVPPPDGFDDWCNVRERRETSSASARYVAAGTVGYEDLDDAGYWQQDVEYGTIWYPRVHSGWAPYREGHWAWIEPWGWTWVDDAPWGFAPFHYGRWVCVRDRWGWIPGPVAVRPVYAPALVAWVGGPSFGVAIGVGTGVGWFPLGWHDPYIPAYRVSPVYARNVNISNSRVVNVTVINNYYSTTNVNVRNTTINNIRYENVKVRNAVTAVPHDAFASGRPVGRNAVVVQSNVVARATVMPGATVVPTKEAVLGGHPPAQAPRRLVMPRQVVSRVAPPPRPVSFEQQRPLIERNNGAPLAPAQRNELRRNSPQPAPRGPQHVVVGQPGGNAPGRGAVAGQPPATQPGRGPAVGRPEANPPARGPVVGRPDENRPGRPAPGNQPPMRNEPVAPTAGQGTPGVSPERPGRNVPRPPQAGGNPATPRGNEGQVNERPVAPPSNTGRGQQGGVDRTVPAAPPREAAPTRETAPPRPMPPQHEAVPNRDLPPSREVAPPRSAPPARETVPTRDTAPVRNVPQPPAREVAPPRETAPVRTAPPAREVAPPREAPPQRSAPPREVAPQREVPPQRNAPPAREVAPQRSAPIRSEAQQQHRNAPPPKENKNEKEKEKNK